MNSLVMNKPILLLIFSILVFGCKSESNMTGKYQTDSVNGNEFTFDMYRYTYSEKMSSGSVIKGRFKIFILSSKKKLIICNDMIMKRTSGDIKESSNVGDSTVVGVWDGYKNLGSTVFEVTSKNETLLFRKTYVNQLQKTESEGVLIKK